MRKIRLIHRVCIEPLLWCINDDLARDSDQPMRRAIAVEDIARLEDRRGVLKGQAVIVYNAVKRESSKVETHDYYEKRAVVDDLETDCNAE